MDYSIPRGIRNNNPLNIRIGNSWRGEVENPTDKDFEQFQTMFWGLRAGFVLLRRYITRYQLNTIEKIISRWAPNNENNTEQYIRLVCKLMGKARTDILSWYDENDMTKLVFEMCIVENGQEVDGSEIVKAYRYVISCT